MFAGVGVSVCCVLAWLAHRRHPVQSACVVFWHHKKRILAVGVEHAPSEEAVALALRPRAAHEVRIERERSIAALHRRHQRSIPAVHECCTWIDEHAAGKRREAVLERSSTHRRRGTRSRREERREGRAQLRLCWRVQCLPKPTKTAPRLSKRAYHELNTRTPTVLTTGATTLQGAHRLPWREQQNPGSPDTGFRATLRHDARRKQDARQTVE